jgi:DNA-binding MarR family transcriptional regulator
MASTFPAIPPSAVPGTSTGGPAALTQAILSTLLDVVSSMKCEASGRLVKQGVSMTHLHVLWTLQHHGDLSMRHLAELLDVSVSSATGIIDRMEERGLVVRARVPGDRRVVLVQLADAGLQALEEIQAVRHGRMTSILAHLAPAQLECLAQALVDIRSALAAEESSAHPLHAHSHA